MALTLKDAVTPTTLPAFYATAGSAPTEAARNALAQAHSDLGRAFDLAAARVRKSGASVTDTQTLSHRIGRVQDKIDALLAELDDAILFGETLTEDFGFGDPLAENGGR